MDLDHAITLVVADQRGYCGKRDIPTLHAIKHVRSEYTHDAVDARWREGSITHRPTAQAYHQIVDADGDTLGRLFATWAPQQQRRIGCSLWLILPIIVIMIVVATALIRQ